MTEAFLKIVNMGISGSWIILAVLLLRFVLKKAPKWVRVLLWGVVAIRLICPFTIESAVSLIPSAETVSPEIITGETVGINSGIPFINNAVSSAVSNAAFGNTAANINQFKIVCEMFETLGVVKWQNFFSVLFEQCKTRRCEKITSPR